MDDEIGATWILKTNLEQTNPYAVRVVNWAEDAAAAARQFKPHLLLLDIKMPRMPGGNVVAVFEADPELRRIPIVFLTAQVRRDVVKDHDGTICGRPCLVKPASLQEIILSIETHSAPLVGVGPPPVDPSPAQPPWAQM